MQPIQTSAQSGRTPPGWFPDPWRMAQWRWWDGRMWTPHLSGGGTAGGVDSASVARKPRLPAWLSPPVVVCALPTAISVIVFAFISPTSVALGLVPLLIVVPTLWWLDRIEPEPRSSLLHSLLWGATVAVFVSSIVNSIVALAAGLEVAAVVSAPLVEEATKGLGIFWAIRRKELDGVVDGVIYAGWVAIGFAVVEDFQYFATADQADQLVEVFLVRGLLTPFAHPLFTFWMGLAAGLAIERKRPVVPFMLVGYLGSVATHAAWNGSITLSATAGGATVIAVALLAFLVLFTAVVISVVRVRRREQAQFLDATPMLVQRYGLSPGELEIFTDWGRLLSTRRSLPKSERRHFDGVHAALARLAVLHGRAGDVDPVDEARLLHLLQQARASAA